MCLISLAALSTCPASRMNRPSAMSGSKLMTATRPWTSWTLRSTAPCSPAASSAVSPCTSARIGLARRRPALALGVGPEQRDRRDGPRRSEPGQPQQRTTCCFDLLHSAGPFAAGSGSCMAQPLNQLRIAHSGPPVPRERAAGLLPGPQPAERPVARRRRTDLRRRCPAPGIRPRRGQRHARGGPRKRPPVVPQARLRRDGAGGRCPGSGPGRDGAIGALLPESVAGSRSPLGPLLAGLHRGPEPRDQPVGAGVVLHRREQLGQHLLGREDRRVAGDLRDRPSASRRRWRWRTRRSW